MNKAIAIRCIAVITVVAFLVYLKTSLWNECRAADHSVFYCWNMVTGE